MTVIIVKFYEFDYILRAGAAYEEEKGWCDREQEGSQRKREV